MCKHLSVNVGLGKVRDFIRTNTAPASPERKAMLQLSHAMFDRLGSGYSSTRFEEAVYHENIQQALQQLLTSGTV